jgi:putative transposase
MVFHVMNRANNRALIFAKEQDYAAFMRVMRDTLERRAMRILGYCVMPNHWHLVLWPEADGDLGAFMQALTTTHVRRWRLHRESVGEGHLYQGPYRSFPVQCDDHFYTVCRYVERNALRAGLVPRAEAWRWSSLWSGLPEAGPDDRPPLCDWPLARPRNWLALVNRAQTEAELAALRTASHRGRPFGSTIWQKQTAKRLGLESTLRPRGRPRKRG